MVSSDPRMIVGALVKIDFHDIRSIGIIVAIGKGTNCFTVLFDMLVTPQTSLQIWEFNTHWLQVIE